MPGPPPSAINEVYPINFSFVRELFFWQKTNAFGNKNRLAKKRSFLIK